MNRQAQRSAAREAAMAACGMCLFALFAHSAGLGILLSVCGLLATLFAFYLSLRAGSSPAALFGFAPLTPKAVACAALGIMLGGAMAGLFRWNSGINILPRGLGGFAPIAACIGCVEEALYRGYVHGRLSRAGPARAVAGAAICHTAYKCALFALPPGTWQTDFGFLAFCTFLGGLAFGALRQYSGSVLPPLAAHAAFDVLVYGELARAPGWVWT